MPLDPAVGASSGQEGPQEQVHAGGGAARDRGDTKTRGGVGVDDGTLKTWPFSWGPSRGQGQTCMRTGWMSFGGRQNWRRCPVPGARIRAVVGGWRGLKRLKNWKAPLQQLVTERIWWLEQNPGYQ